MAAQVVDGVLKPDTHILEVSQVRFAELKQDDDLESVPGSLIRLFAAVAH